MDSDLLSDQTLHKLHSFKLALLENYNLFYPMKFAHKFLKDFSMLLFLVTIFLEELLMIILLCIWARIMVPFLLTCKKSSMVIIQPAIMKTIILPINWLHLALKFFFKLASITIWNYTIWIFKVMAKWEFQHKYQTATKNWQEKVLKSIKSELQQHLILN